jgi:hypothetical protein
MMSRAASLLPFFANPVAFSACAVIAFARNINAPFYHFDGSYMLVDGSKPPPIHWGSGP